MCPCCFTKNTNFFEQIVIKGSIFDRDVLVTDLNPIIWDSVSFNFLFILHLVVFESLNYYAKVIFKNIYGFVSDLASK